MKILLTNHHLLGLAGTETYTYTLAKYLVKNGHQVTIYSHYLGNIKSNFDESGVPITTSLGEIKSQTFDIAHVHHNINAIEIRYHFPVLPIVLQIHGRNHFLEQLPIVDLNISHYLAVTETVVDKLTELKIDPQKISLGRNLIDSKLFRSVKPINDIPQKAVIISAYLPPNTEKIIRESCQQLNISCQFFGGRFKIINQTEIVNQINQSDIVFSLGRGAMEAMFCQRVPIIYDYQGGDGLVTPTNFSKIAKSNFSGLTYSHQYTVQELVAEIKKYQPSFGSRLQILSRDYYDADINTKKLISIYSRIIKSNPKIKISSQAQEFCHFFVNAINETRNYTQLDSNQKIFNKQPYKLIRTIKNLCIKT